jgi:hypothetical protein
LNVAINRGPRLIYRSIIAARNNCAGHPAEYAFNDVKELRAGGQWCQVYCGPRSLSRTSALAEVVGLAREASPRPILRMIELIDSEDERVALMTAEKVLERAWGKPREAVAENSVKDMTPEQRRQRFCEILAFAAQLKVPDAIPHTNGADYTLEEAVDPLEEVEIMPRGGTDDGLCSMLS